MTDIYAFYTIQLSFFIDYNVFVVIDQICILFLYISLNTLKKSNLINICYKNSNANNKIDFL